MTSIRNSRVTTRVLLAAFGLAFALVGVMFATPAFAANVQLDAPTTVSDDITRLHVSKLDADTREYVVGATMVIVNESTNEVVDSWITGTSTHENEKGLDVGVTYILRELEAPSGYDKVQDVRFVVNEIEGSGITILSSGDDAELNESYRVTLYDKQRPTEQETVVTRANPSNTTTVSTTPTSSTNTSTTSTTDTTKVVAPKTGDEAPLSLIAALVGIGIIAILLLQLFKRRETDE